MKRLLHAAVILLVCTPAFAGLRYEFSSVTSGKGGGNMIGAASVEGSNMRLEIRKGDNILFKDSSVVLSSDGGKTLTILDPKSKTYYELPLEETFKAVAGAFKAMGPMMKMSFDNQKVDVTPAVDGGEIQGYPTRKHVVNVKYDMNVRVMGMKTSSTVDMTTESWITDKIAADQATFVQAKTLRTGVEDIDRLIETQMTAATGFPLKSIVTTTTTQGKKSETSTTTMEVSKIEQAAIPASQFEVPAGYSKTDSPMAGLESLR
ncbi:MAG TPA: DUF4412 domain-containing protein [Thermoanaerobaculia bacterium]|nr:DUF4412 domain-containing protein [Thermoanaerobaculia bacterium]